MLVLHHLLCYTFYSRCFFTKDRAMFSGKNKKFLEEFTHLIQICEDGMSAFDEAIEYYLQKGINGTFCAKADEVKKFEDKADKQVYKIKDTLYGNFLLPEAREDIAILINELDDIIDEADHILKYIITRNLKPIPSLCEDYREMLQAITKCFEKTVEAALLLFGAHKQQEIKELTEEIGAYESMSDRMEERIITEIYKMDLQGIEPILQSELTLKIASIADNCEDTGSVISIMNLKRII